MKVVALEVVALAAVMLLASPAFAQDNPTAPNSPTAPQNRGATGWTGATRDQKQENAAEDARQAAGQPWMAEGLDLKEPPRQFPPKETVE
jgi:hypothetical protein